MASMKSSKTAQKKKVFKIKNRDFKIGGKLTSA